MKLVPIGFGAAGYGEPNVIPRDAGRNGEFTAASEELRANAESPLGTG
jgi:hypothetical protein